MTAPPGSTRLPSTTGRPADIRVSKVIRHRLASALCSATGMTFREARAVIADRAGETREEIEAWLWTTFRIDPTGVLAVRNVTRERGY